MCSARIVHRIGLASIKSVSILVLVLVPPIPIAESSIIRPFAIAQRVILAMLSVIVGQFQQSVRNAIYMELLIYLAVGFKKENAWC